MTEIRTMRGARQNPYWNRFKRGGEQKPNKLVNIKKEKSSNLKRSKKISIMRGKSISKNTVKIYIT